MNFTILNIKRVRLHLKLLVIAFALSLIGYFMMGLYWNSVISSDIAYKPIYNELLNGYDHNIISDFFNKDSKLFSVVNIYSIVFFIISLLLYIFIHSGLLWLSNSEQNVSISEFFGKCKQYFLKNLGLGLIYLLLLVLAIGIHLYVIVIQILGKIGDVPSEKPLVFLGVFLIVVMLVVILYVITASIVSRKLIMENNLSTWNSIKKGVSIAFKKFIPYFASWIIFLSITILLAWFYIELVVIIDNLALRIYSQLVFLLLLFLIKFNLYSSIRINEDLNK